MQLDKWAEIRTKGRKKYILKYGVLLSALPVYLIVNFVLNAKPIEEINPADIVIGATVWFSGGLFYGAWMWNSNERAYLKKTKENASTTGNS